MKKLTITAIALASALGGTAHSAGNNEPALELRNAFINQYASRGASKGAAMDAAAREGGCIFDVMASRLTVSAYIRVVQDTRNATTAADLQPLMPEIKQKCFPNR